MDISLSSEALDVAFHPSSSSNLLVTGLISGKVQLIDYGAGTAGREAQEDEKHAASGSSKSKKTYTKRWTVRPSNKSCRGVAFSADGEDLYSLSKDGSIFRLDTETGSTVSHWSKAHEAAPSRILPIGPNLLASGDDDGVINLWDPRRPTTSSTPIRSYTHHFDWITSMLWCTHLAPPKQAKPSKEEQERRRAREEKKRKRKERKGHVQQDDEDDDDEDNDQGAPTTQRERLVVTSGDGTLSVIDVRAGKSAVEVSEDQEDELLSIAAVKRNSKLVVGTQMGILSLWAPTKGLLDHVDRIPGHPASVDTMCTLDDDTILTGSSDGLVRVVQILPHKLLGVVADHGGMPVERIARKDNWMASIGHGAEIKLTDLAPLLDEEEDEEGEGQPLGVTQLSAGYGDGSSDEEDEDDAGADLEAYSEGEEEKRKEEQGDDDGEEDDSSEEEIQAKARPLKKARAAPTILRPAPVQKEQRGDMAGTDFFADL